MTVKKISTRKGQINQDLNCGIYRIRNIRNNKSYVGSSKNLRTRRREHFYLLGRNVHHSRYLQNAFNVEPLRANFKFEILVLCAPENLILYEQACLDSLPCEYNIARIAGRPVPWEHKSEEAKKLHSQKSTLTAVARWAKLSETERSAIMREISLRRPAEERSEAARAAAQTRKLNGTDVRSESTRTKMRIKQTGKTRSLETRHLMRLGKLGDKNPIHRETPNQKAARTAKMRATKLKNNSYTTKLVEKDVVEILQSDLSVSKLSKMYNVSYAAIWDVRHARTWTHIPRETQPQSRQNRNITL
jgi:group I intron endonuclease